MLAYLRGTLQAQKVTGGPADSLVLDVAGVGFELSVSPRTLGLCGQIGQEITLQTSLSIRENDWTIFGFARQEEREMFALLQSVSGVGPKLALSLVGTFDPQQLAAAIVSEDHKFISQAQGVGAKMAQRIVLELKSKVDDWQLRHGLAGSTNNQSNNATLDEVRQILQGLGYTATEIGLVLQDTESFEPDQDVEGMVRQSLKILGASGR